MKLLLLTTALTCVLCDRYIVTSRKPLLNAQQGYGAERDGFSIGDTYFQFIESDEPPFHLYAHEDVLDIERDTEISMTDLYPSALYDLQNNPAWNLDRADQRSPVLNRKYFSHKSGGRGVDNYVLDTGVDIRHPDFGGRATWGANFADGEGSNGCMDAHGTHVAGTIGSSTYGIAKKTNLISVKVLDCQGSGRVSSVIRGVEYAYKNPGSNRKVINMSLGGPVNVALNRAVAEASKAGIIVVAAAGNENSDACLTSPASETSAISVGATDVNDRITYFSNWGTCVDVFAPGSRIKSLVPNGGTETFDGTSQAAPLVAGIVSLILSSSTRTKPLSSQEIKDFISRASTKDAVSGNIRGSPNNLAFSLSYVV